MNFINHGIEIDSSNGNQQKVRCPECTPGRKKQHLKDLSVNIKKGVWNCKHCGWAGSLKIREIRPMTKIYKKPEPRTLQSLPAIANWLEDRGISIETQAKYNVSHENAWMPGTGKEEQCVVFNYFIGGELINRKYRDINKNHRLEKGAELVMYNPDKLDNSHEGACHITEGEIDTLTLLECGYPCSYSVPNGAPPENSDINSVDFSYLPSLDRINRLYKEVILVMDNDKVGIRLRDEIARRIGVEKCYTVEYPEGCKDINDVFVKHGKNAVHACLKNCEPYPIKGLYGAEDFKDSLLEYFGNGFTSGVSTGWLSVDRIYKPRKKEFTVVTGIPSHGKSVWLDNLMLNIVASKKWKFGIFSPENAPCERHLANLCEIIIGKPFSKRYNGHMSKEEVLKAQEILNKHFFFIMPVKDTFDIDTIFDLAKSALFKHGIDGLLIDPWNEIEHNRGNMSETDYVSKALSKTRYFSRVNDIHTWIVAHPTKLYKDKATGEYPVPTPYDISGSAHWRNKPDNCLCVHRNVKENYTSILSQKIRFKECGSIGEAVLKFDIKNSQFRE